MVVVTGDVCDGGFGADDIDQAAEGSILGGREVLLEGIGGGRTRAADQVDVNHTVIVAFEPGADLGFRAAGQGGTVAIDKVVVADLAPAALFAVPVVDFLAIGGEWFAPYQVGGCCRVTPISGSASDS